MAAQVVEVGDLLGGREALLLDEAGTRQPRHDLDEFEDPGGNCAEAGTEIGLVFERERGVGSEDFGSSLAVFHRRVEVPLAEIRIEGEGRKWNGLFSPSSTN